MNLLKNNVGVRGKAQIHVIKADGTKKPYLNEECTIKNGATIDNDILDSFFSEILGVSSPSHRSTLRVGTGAGATNLTQTELTTPYTPLTGHWPYEDPNNSNYIDGAYTIFKAEYEFLFDIGQLVGNFSELGLYYNAAATSTSPNSDYYVNYSSRKDVHTRLLITDGMGDPTTITVLADEQLKVTYTLEGRITTADEAQVTSYLDEGVSTPITITKIRTGSGIFGSLFCHHFSYSDQSPPSQFRASDSSVGATGANPAVLSEQASIIDADTTTKRVKEITFNSDVANWAGGIQGFFFGSSLSSHSFYHTLYKWDLSAPIAKNNTQKLSFNIETTYSRV